MSSPFQDINNKLALKIHSKENSSATIGSQVFSVSLEKMFSQQFFQKIKTEIGQKVKPSKSVLEALKHSNSLNQGYKQQIRRLQSHVDLLTEKNIGLSKIIAQNVKQGPDLLAQSAKKDHQLSIFAMEPISIQNKKSAETSIPMEILKQKIQFLEEIKALKEQRYSEMVQKQATLKGQINLLKHRNDQLLSKVRDLENVIQGSRLSKASALPYIEEPSKKDSVELMKSRHMTCSLFSGDQLQRNINKTKKNESKQESKQYHNEEDEGFRIYINQKERTGLNKKGKANESDIQSETIPFDSLQDENLMISNTKAIEIEEGYNIEKLATQKIVQQKAEQAFQEMDGLLEQELPNTSTIQDINSERVQQNWSNKQRRQIQRHNNSFIQINTDPSQDMMQSMIQITVEK